MMLNEVRRKPEKPRMAKLPSGRWIVICEKHSGVSWDPTIAYQKWEKKNANDSSQASA
jgi:hypothetical protein